MSQKTPHKVDRDSIGKRIASRVAATEGDPAFRDTTCAACGAPVRKGTGQEFYSEDEADPEPRGTYCDSCMSLTQGSSPMRVCYDCGDKYYRGEDHWCDEKEQNFQDNNRTREQYGSPPLERWDMNWRPDQHKGSAQDIHCVVYFHHDGKQVSEITAELAASPRKRALGLSQHQDLHPAAGMLFVNPSGPKERSETFHMSTVRFPIDILFLRADQRIGKIVHNIQPGTPGNWTYPKTAAVVETVGGYCKARGIKAGDLVRIGSIKQAQSKAPQVGDRVEWIPRKDYEEYGETDPKAGMQGTVIEVGNPDGPGLGTDDLIKWDNGEEWEATRREFRIVSQKKEPQWSHPMPGEAVLGTPTGRWQYVSDAGQAKYYHLDCDGYADQNGDCMLCGAPSPSSLRYRAQKTAARNWMVVIEGPGIGTQVAYALESEFAAKEKAQELRAKRDSMGSSARISISQRMSGSGKVRDMSEPEVEEMLRQASRRAAQMYCDGCGSFESLTATFGDTRPAQMYWLCDNCAEKTGKKEGMQMSLPKMPQAKPQNTGHPSKDEKPGKWKSPAQQETGGDRDAQMESKEARALEHLLPAIDKAIEEGGGSARADNLPGGPDAIQELIDSGVLFDVGGGYVRRRLPEDKDRKRCDCMGDGCPKCDYTTYVQAQSERPEICQACGRPVDYMPNEGPYSIEGLSPICPECMDEYVQGEESKEATGYSVDPLKSLTEV